MLSKFAHITSDGMAASIHSNFQYVSEEILENSALQLNHYAIQSMEWFQQVKMTRGDSSSPKNENVRTLAYFKEHDFRDMIDTELASKRAADLCAIWKATAAASTAAAQSARFDLIRRPGKRRPPRLRQSAADIAPYLLVP